MKKLKVRLAKEKKPEKKSDLIQDMTIKEYLQVLSSAQNMLGSCCATALLAAQAAALGAMACKISNNQKLAEEEKLLDAMTDFFMRQIEEDRKSFLPLEKALKMDKDDPERKLKLPAALRIAIMVPTDVMFSSARCAEALIKVGENCRKSILSDIVTALEFSLTAMKTSRFLILENTDGMVDEVFKNTIRLEGEILFEETEGKILKAIEKFSTKL